MEWSDGAIVLSVRPYGETAAILEVLTREHGRHLGLVHGGASRKTRAILQAGNTIHAIMGMWMDGWGIEISETILVTRNGCEALTKMRREIHQKP